MSGPDSGKNFKGIFEEAASYGEYLTNDEKIKKLLGWAQDKVKKRFIKKAMDVKQNRETKKSIKNILTAETRIKYGVTRIKRLIR